MTSFDSDATTDAFFFTFAADAPEAVRIDTTTGLGLGLGLAESGSEGEDTDPVLVGVVVAITVLFAVLAVFVWRANTRRNPETDWKH